MKVVCISDTHGDHRAVELPPGELLVHAGDVTAHGSRSDFIDFLDWFSDQTHRHRVFIAGNHDVWVEREPLEADRLATEAGVTLLNDSGIELDGLRIWGSPITPRFLDWSFMRDPGKPIERHWRQIPEHIDLLVTHGPPHGVLDRVERSFGKYEHTGCPSLLQTVARVRPQAHVFGHIHEGHGEYVQGGVRYVNVSTMNPRYCIANAPVVLELTPAPQEKTA